MTHEPERGAQESETTSFHSNDHEGLAIVPADESARRWLGSLLPKLGSLCYTQVSVNLLNRGHRIFGNGVV